MSGIIFTYLLSLTSITRGGEKGKGLELGNTTADGFRRGDVKPSGRAAKNGGDKMDVFDQNVKIHVDTSDLDVAVKKAEQFLARLKKAQEITVPQGATEEVVIAPVETGTPAVEFILHANSGYTIDELLKIVAAIQKSHPNAEIRVEAEL